MFTNKNSVPFFSIDIIACELNIHQRTLRIWDKEGILIPKRTQKNQRRYSLDDFKKAKFILFLTRNLSLNLTGVKIIFQLLEKLEIKLDDYIDFINNIAKSLKIDEKIQQENFVKNSKKGKRAC